MMDKYRCRLTDTVFVKQRALPQFSLGNDTTIALSDSLLLKAPDGYFNYQWNDFSSERERLVKSENGQSGIKEFFLTVTDSLSCCYTDTIAVTFLPEYNWIDLKRTEIIVYPNPTRDKISWYLKTEETCQLVAELTDKNGRRLYYQHIKEYNPSETKEIYLGNMPSGIYNLKIRDSIMGLGYKTFQIIKQ